MLSDSITPDFTTLLANGSAITLSSQLEEIISDRTEGLRQALLDTISTAYSKGTDLNILSVNNNERIATDWLIGLFNNLFIQQQVELVRGAGEPEYFPVSDNNPARIEFAHGFFASALHEISHWCIAGQERRQLSDFGYWYAPDGRSEAQQQAFERVEIKPQALECLFTLACKRDFQVSQDNLFANFDTSSSTFASDVYSQAQHYIDQPQTLPPDAQTLLAALLTLDGTLL